MNQHKYIYNAVIEHFNDMSDCNISGVAENDYNKKFRLVIDGYANQHEYTKQGIVKMLQDLVFDIDYLYSDIEKLLVSWNVKPTWKNTQNYYNVLAFRILQLYKVITNDVRVQKLLNK